MTSNENDHVHLWSLDYNDSVRFEDKDSIELNCYEYDSNRKETCYATKSVHITEPTEAAVRFLPEWHDGRFPDCDSTGAHYHRRESGLTVPGKVWNVNVLFQPASEPASSEDAGEGGAK